VNSIGYEAKEGHTSVQARQAGPKIRKGLGEDRRFTHEASTLLTDLPQSSSELFCTDIDGYHPYKRSHALTAALVPPTWPWCRRQEQLARAPSSIFQAQARRVREGKEETITPFLGDSFHNKQ